MTSISTLEALKSSTIEALKTVEGETALYDSEVQSFEDNRQDPTKEEFECALRGHQLKQVKDIIKARKKFARKIFNLVKWWLVSVLVIICVQGIAQLFDKVFLSDKALMTLIGGTTLNVIGIFTVVANFLFPKNGHSSFLSLLTNDAKKEKKKVKKEKKAKTDTLGI